MSFSFLISGTSAVFSVFCAPAHPVILRRSRRILKHPPTTSTMRTVERKTAGHHPLPSPRRPRDVLVKSACLRFRLRRKLRPLLMTEGNPRRGLVLLPTKPAALGFRGDPRKVPNVSKTGEMSILQNTFGLCSSSLRLPTLSPLKKGKRPLGPPSSFLSPLSSRRASAPARSTHCLLREWKI